MKILKRTLSLDPKTKKLIKAKVIEDKNKVYLVKKLGRKNKKILIEKDLTLYKLLQSKYIQIYNLYITEPSMDCNLKCPVCFVYGQHEDIPLEEIKNAISNYKNKIVSISGGEPTLRNDLPEMIKIINKNNISLLTTNGIKLTKYKYVKTLEKAGLRHIIFSANGFSDDVYLKINGAPLLKQKLKALENLERTKMKLSLSLMLVRNINEKELKPTIAYAVKNKKNIREVRIRSMTPIGKYIKQREFLPSEILDLICKEWNIDKKDIYKELELKKYITEKFFSLRTLQKLCAFSFHLKIENGNYESIGKYIKDTSLFSILKYLNTVYGFLSIFNMKIRPKKSFWHHKNNIMKISIRSWPTPEKLDYEEHVKLCGSKYLTGKKKGLPCCYANILESLNK